MTKKPSLLLFERDAGSGLWSVQWMSWTGDSAGTLIDDVPLDVAERVLREHVQTGDYEDGRT